MRRYAPVTRTVATCRTVTPERVRQTLTCHCCQPRVLNLRVRHTLTCHCCQPRVLNLRVRPAASHAPASCHLHRLSPRCLCCAPLPWALCSSRVPQLRVPWIVHGAVRGHAPGAPRTLQEDRHRGARLQSWHDRKNTLDHSPRRCAPEEGRRRRGGRGCECDGAGESGPQGASTTLTTDITRSVTSVTSCIRVVARASKSSG